MDERGARYAVKDLTALVNIIRASIGVLQAGEMSSEDMRQDLSAMRALLNRVEKQT